MIAILSVTAPVFLLILLGFGAVRGGWVPREGTLAMGRYVLSFALPALLFNVLAKRPLGEVVVPSFLLAYAAGSLIAFAIGVAVASALRRTPPLGNAFFGMGVSMSNSGYIGYALISQLYGTQVLVAVAMTILVEVLLIMPLTLVMAEFHAQGIQGGPARGPGDRVSLARALRNVAVLVARNPILQAIAAGLLCGALKVTLPPLIGRTLDLLAGSAAAVALFAVGGSLAGERIHRGLAASTGIAAGKLLIHPLAVGGCLLFAPALDPPLTQAALILAGLPMVTIFPLLAQRYGEGERCASALLITTLLSFVTLNLGLWAGGVRGVASG